MDIDHNPYLNNQAYSPAIYALLSSGLGVTSVTMKREPEETNNYVALFLSAMCFDLHQLDSNEDLPLAVAWELSKLYQVGQQDFGVELQEITGLSACECGKSHEADIMAFNLFAESARLGEHQTAVNAMRGALMQPGPDFADRWGMFLDGLGLCLLRLAAHTP